LQRLQHLPKPDMIIKDITQVYVQAHTKLIQQVFAWLPKEIAKEFPKKTVFIIMLPLYNIPKSRNY